MPKGIQCTLLHGASWSGKEMVAVGAVLSVPAMVTADVSSFTLWRTEGKEWSALGSLLCLKI
jgi:hypothetical protein